VHHVHADGSAVLLLADDEPLLDRARTGGQGWGPVFDRTVERSHEAVPPAGRTAVMLELADRAPVDLRHRRDDTREDDGSARIGPGPRSRPPGPSADCCDPDELRVQVHKLVGCPRS
jgi:hypothetical protein